jgi:hypothetical protein
MEPWTEPDRPRSETIELAAQQYERLARVGVLHPGAVSPTLSVFKPRRRQAESIPEPDLPLSRPLLFSLASGSAIQPSECTSMISLRLGSSRYHLH